MYSCQYVPIAVLQDPQEDTRNTAPADGKDNEHMTAVEIKHSSPDSETKGALDDEDPLPAPSSPAVAPELDAEQPPPMLDVAVPASEDPLQGHPSPVPASEDPLQGHPSPVPASDVPPAPVAWPSAAAGVNDLPDAVTAALDALPLPPADVVNLLLVGGSDSPSPAGAELMIDGDDEPPSVLVQAPTRMGESLFAGGDRHF